MDELTRKIVEAIILPGPNPLHHYTVLRYHREEWPALWELLEQLVLASVGAQPTEET